MIIKELHVNKGQIKDRTHIIMILNPKGLVNKMKLCYIWIFIFANPVDVLTWSSDIPCSTEHFPTKSQ